MTKRAAAASPPGIAEWDHKTTRERLPEYVTALTLGGPPGADDPDVAAHLELCAACRGELEELLALTRAAYAGEIEPAAAYPAPDLSFLPPPVPTPPPAGAGHGRACLIDEAGRLVVQFSQALLDLLRPPALAGAARGRLLYRYTQSPGSVADLDLTIEVFAEEADPVLGRISVCVEAPDRDPLDQAGALVTLHAGDLAHSGETDETGSIDFAAVPLAALATLRVTVRRGEPGA